MSVARAYPWLTLSEDPEGLEATEWHVEDVTAEVPRLVSDSGTFLSAVDFVTRLRFSRTIEFDWQNLGSLLGMEGSRLALVVTAESGQSGGRRRRKVCCDEIDMERTPDASSLSFVLEGRELAKNIVIETKLVLAHRRVGGNPLAARYPGSILWRERWKRSIEGDQPMLPMRGRNDGRTDWLWRISFDADEWDIPFSAALVVEINQNRPEFMNTVTEAEGDVIQLLGSAVASVVLRSYLDREEWEESQNFEEGTCGFIAESWLAQAFNGWLPKAVQELAKHDPGRFETALQAAFDTYRARGKN